MSLANAGHTRQNDYGRVGQNLSNALSSPLGYPIQGNNKTKKSRPSSAEGTMMGRRLFASFTGLSIVGVPGLPGTFLAYDAPEMWGSGMPNSTYFAWRAAHYRQLAGAALNEKIVSSHLALANMFLQLAGDLRRIELTTARLADEASNTAA
jgi:hypothetical protein